MTIFNVLHCLIQGTQASGNLGIYRDLLKPTSRDTEGQMYLVKTEDCIIEEESFLLVASWGATFLIGEKENDRGKESQ